MSPPRFDLQGLKRRLGGKRALRGETYHENGWAEIVALEGETAYAFVRGETGRTYPVQVDAAGQGACTCPDYPIERACKHLMAAALAADALEPAEARRLSGRLERLRETLAFEGPDALADRLTDLAARVPGVLEALDLESDTAP